MGFFKVVLYISAIILVSLSVSEGGKRPRGKKYPVKPLFGVGLGYKKIVSYKPVLVFHKHKHYKVRHHGGWGWGGWHGHGHHHGGHGHHGGGGHHGGHGHGHGHHGGGGHGHGGWGHHDGWSRRGSPGWGWEEESYDDPHEHYGGWESSLTSSNWTGDESPPQNHDEVNHSPISTRPEMHDDNLSNHNPHTNINNNNREPFNEARLNQQDSHSNGNQHPHHNSKRNKNNRKNQAPDQGQHHPLIQMDERSPTHRYEEDERYFSAENAKISQDDSRNRFPPHDPFHNFHNSDFLRRRRHQNGNGRRRDSIQDVLAGASANFDVVYVNEKEGEEVLKKNKNEGSLNEGSDERRKTSASGEFQVEPHKMEFITTPSSFFSTTAFPSFKEFRSKRFPG